MSIFRLISLTLLIAFVTACGTAADDASKNDDKAKGSNWNEMKWDEGKWK